MSARKPKDRSHWGDMAFKAMVEKSKSVMSAPTARELIAQPHGLSCDELSKRVEAVLALHQLSHDRDGKPVGVCADCGWSVPCPTVRALDGGKP